VDAIYLFDGAGALHGPVILTEIPGLGAQMPSNAIVLPKVLAAPKVGHVWTLTQGQVTLLPDFRGTVYSTVDGAQQQHTALGDLPVGFASVPRPSAAYLWQDGAWVKSATYLHARKTAEINRGCELSITGGFWSSALGSAYQYSSELDDQLNLTGVILRGEESPYACRDEQGQKAFLLHSALQLRQVGDDFTLFKLQLLQKANRLKQQLDQALSDGDVAAIEALSGEDPQA